MVAQYTAELANAWLRGLPPRQVHRLELALGGARECLALFLRGPVGRQRVRRGRGDMLARPMQWALAYWAHEGVS